MQRTIIKVAVGVFSTILLLGARAQAAGTPEKCQAAKTKALGKLAACIAKERAKEISGKTPDFAKCNQKFTDKFAAAEASAGPGVCPTEGDAADLGNAMDDTIQLLGGTLEGVRFIDNGDGTVLDVQTGLQWEMKDDLGGIHDKDNVYTWTDPVDLDFTDADGTAFTEFLDNLNTGDSTDGTSVNGCFAGHCDWRLPTIVELQTLFVAPDPCVNPCIDPIFGPTVGSKYWSSTAITDSANWAWFGDFLDGTIENVIENKFNTNYVRAVRDQ